MPAKTIILPTARRDHKAPGYYAEVLYSDHKERIAFNPRTRKRIKGAANRRSRRMVNRVLSSSGAAEL